MYVHIHTLIYTLYEIDACLKFKHTQARTRAHKCPGVCVRVRMMLVGICMYLRERVYYVGVCMCVSVCACVRACL